MIRSHPFLQLPAALLGLALASTSARGGFVTTTSVTGVSYSGGSLTSATLGAGSTFGIDSSTIVVGSGGGSSYTDTAGTTVYFVNDVRTAGTQSVPNEQIYVANTTAGATDTGTFTFTVNILVTNNSATGTFTEGPNTLSMNLSGANANYLVFPGTLAPPSMTVGGTLFTSSLPQGTSGDINSANNGAVSAVITAVPEPSTIALLGMGGLVLIAPRLRRLVRYLGRG